MPPAVRLTDITKRFPGVIANDHVDLTVEDGSVHAILGENGAGKSTLMKILYGLYQPDEGTIEIDGEPKEFDSPQDAIEAGIGMIHQHFKLVEPLTVAQNVTLGSEPRDTMGVATDTGAAREAVRDLASQYGFDIDPSERIEEISVGEQQRVEILKSLYRGSEILILDEPTAVLTPQEVEGLFEVIEELRDQGKTIIFITHKLGEAMEAASEITVLRDGKNVGTVDAKATTREELAKLMVGREVVLETQKRPHDAGDTVLSVENLTVTDRKGRPEVDDLSFTVQAGEIFGIAGVDGNGQGELAEAITGLTDIDDGTIRFRGDDISAMSRRERIDIGTAYIPEDRQKRGLVMDFNLAENALLGAQHHLKFGERNADREGAADIIETYDVETRGVDSIADSLSGGNQQKFIVGREFEREPEFIFAAHPTRGLDVGSIEFIHDRLLEFREDDRAVLLVSSKLDELQQLADRLAVIYEGEFVDIVDPDEVTEQDLGLMMAGEDRSETETTSDEPQRLRQGSGESGVPGGDDR
ncbi:MAG: ABC transporter ATP-binding protein [Halobacteriaceae archaeon]